MQEHCNARSIDIMTIQRMQHFTFLVKKIISRLCFTLTLPWLLLICGLIFPEYLFTNVVIVVSGCILAGPLGQGLLWLLSRRYPQLDVRNLPCGREYLICVAGSGFKQHSRRVPESWFGDNLVIRLTEAGRVAQELAQRDIPFQICVSMPEHPDMSKEKLLGLQAFFRRFGIVPEQISIVDTALDSEDEVKTFRLIHEPLIIVSNSWNIPRLMLAAHLERVEAIPAPGGQIFQAPKLHLNLNILPTGSGIQGLECALHEIAGMIALKLKGLF